LTLLHPHLFARGITEEQATALIGAQWREYLLEQQLSVQELRILQNIVRTGTSLEKPYTNAPVQVELIKHRLERAKLEVQFYSLALDEIASNE
jgi:hypothetical protein